MKSRRDGLQPGSRTTGSEEAAAWMAWRVPARVTAGAGESPLQVFRFARKLGYTVRRGGESCIPVAGSFQGGERMVRIYTTPLCLLVAWLSLFLIPFPAGADTAYQWTDAQGTTHFTNDLTTVPASYQGEVKTVPLPEPSSPPPPAHVTSPPQTDAAEEPEENPELVAYKACSATLKKTKEGLQKALVKDRDLLEQLTQAIHRSTTSRHKNKMQRTRVEVKERIQRNQEKLDQEIPRMEWECNLKKPYLP